MRKARWAAGVLAGALALPLLAVPAQARPESPGRTEPVHSWTEAIRETVKVMTTDDADRDGRPDEVVVDIMRPRGARNVPVIMVASPYWSLFDENHRRDRQRDLLLPDSDDFSKDRELDGSPELFPQWYDNYFVPRGYAVALVDAPGTRFSTGCLMTGGRSEVNGVRTAVEWFAGRGTAHTVSGAPVKADWSSGNVGMIGVSWVGTLPVGVAATGVPNLKTIVPIAAISSWYDYTRYNGLRRIPDYARFLAKAGSPRRDDPTACDPIADEQAAASADDTGNYNAYWAERDYLRSVKKIKASVLVAHGLEDKNVRPGHAANLWRGLETPAKLWLARTTHADPFRGPNRARWMELLHRWFDHELYGIENGVMDEPAVLVEQNAGQFAASADWPVAGQTTRYWLGKSASGSGSLGAERGQGQLSFTNLNTQTQAQMVADPDTPAKSRLAFVSPPLPHAVRISGNPTIQLRASIGDRELRPLTAYLVDYGRTTRANDDAEIEGSNECIGTGTDAVDCYPQYRPVLETSDETILTEGWQSTLHRTSLTHQTPVSPGTLHRYRWDLQPDDDVIPAGHRIGLVIASDDCQTFSLLTGCPTTPAEGPAVTVDLSQSYLDLPVAEAN